jgi:hypothetical protein
MAIQSMHHALTSPMHCSCTAPALLKLLLNELLQHEAALTLNYCRSTEAARALLRCCFTEAAVRLHYSCSIEASQVAATAACGCCGAALLLLPCCCSGCCYSSMWLLWHWQRTCNAHALAAGDALHLQPRLEHI